MRSPPRRVPGAARKFASAKLDWRLTSITTAQRSILKSQGGSFAALASAQYYVTRRRAPRSPNELVVSKGLSNLNIKSVPKPGGHHH